MTINSIFISYLDANLILVFAAILWCITRFLLNNSNFKFAGLLKLRLVYSALIAVAAAPVMILLHNAVASHGVFGAGYSASLSDYALAQFLSGRIEMAPLEFEALWMFRTNFAQSVATLATPVGVAVVVFCGMGFAIFGIRFLCNALKVRALIRHGYAWRRFGRLHIVVSDRVSVPFSARGLRGRYIVVPSEMLSRSDDVRIAIAHELQHMRQGDLEWEVVLEIIRPFFFWNPAFLFLKKEVEELREVACDQQVLMRRRIGVRDYCDCLLRVCRSAASPKPVQHVLVPSVPLLRGDQGRRAIRSLKLRVSAIVSGRTRNPARWVTGLMVLPFVALITVGSIASQSSGDWSQDRLMLSTIVNLERLDQRTLATRY